MRIPIPPGAERAARSLIVPGFALVHLLGFHLFRTGVLPASHAGKWAATAFAGAGILLLRERLPGRRADRLPDLLSIATWAGAALLELHAWVPSVAESRIVPALLFPALAYLLPAAPAAVCALVSFAWLSWTPGLAPGIGAAAAANAAMGGIGFAAGIWIRRKTGSPDPDGAEGKRRDESSDDLLSPWERPGGEPEFVFGRIPEGEDILGVHERRTTEGIRRVLEGILPVAGADRVMFVTRSEEQGRPFLARYAAWKDGKDGGTGQAIPDSFIPLREALVFRRAFFAEGEEAAEWGLPFGGRTERPTGVAAVPVLHEGVEEGAILAFRHARGEWQEPAVPLLETGAFLLGREIAEGRNRYRSDRTLAAVAGFYRFFRRIWDLAEGGAVEGTGSASLRREICRATAEEVRTGLRADRVLLVEGEEQGTRARIAWESGGGGAPDGGGEEEQDGGWVPLDGTYAGWVLEKGIHRIFTEARGGAGRHPVLPADWARPGEVDFLLHPVSGAGGFRGLLACASRAGRNFHGRDAEAARELIAIMRMGLSHSRTIGLLEEQATADGLTGLLNRKTFRARLAAVLSRLDGRYPCALLMLDIDHFKRINDTHGHPAGDEVLRKVAEIIRKTIRKVDMGGRLGGEEFAVYLHHADRERAGNAAERLRMIIGKARFTFDGREIGVTASLGIACCPEDGRTIEELLGRADEALYRSKQGGRNRSTFYRRPAV